MAFAVCLGLGLQTYSRGVCPLLVVSSSGLGFGPSSFGSLSPHWAFRCVVVWFISDCCCLFVVVQFRKLSGVVWAGPTSHPLSTGCMSVLGRLSRYLPCRSCGRLPRHTVCQVSMGCCWLIGLSLCWLHSAFCCPCCGWFSMWWCSGSFSSFHVLGMKVGKYLYLFSGTCSCIFSHSALNFGQFLSAAP